MKTPAGVADLRFYFDPVCPFCWMTSKWVRMVAARRGYRVDWRFIALRLVNARIDYAAHFPPEYEEGHTAGLRLLRMAARTRAEQGPAAVERLYAALGTQIFDAEFVPDTAEDHGLRGSRAFVAPVLAAAGLPANLAEALDDTTWDAVVQAETDEALALAGKDVGTPILQFVPPDGPAFFGPVISRLPGRGRGRGTVGPRGRPRPVPGLRRAQAQPARAAAAARARCGRGRGRRRAGLARREPQAEALMFDTRFSRLGRTVGDAAYHLVVGGAGRRCGRGTASRRTHGAGSALAVLNDRLTVRAA